MLISGASLPTGAATAAAAESSRPDAGFLAELSSAGVLAAANEMGGSLPGVMAAMTEATGHPYREYRWWIQRDADHHPVIHAMPPEAEAGWTPWERWVVISGKPVHQLWVLFPLKNPSPKGIPIWYQLENETGLEPLWLRPAATLEAQLRRARVDVAADVLGLDFQKTFLDSLTRSQRETYRQFRWVVMPHSLAADQPVVYALPPMNRAEDWPWESWYTDGVTPRLHHVHYTKENSLAKTRWSEFPGALQRPPEIGGVTWFWYDSKSMTPALAQPAPSASLKDSKPPTQTRLDLPLKF